MKDNKNPLYGNDYDCCVKAVKVGLDSGCITFNTGGVLMFYKVHYECANVAPACFTEGISELASNLSDLSNFGIATRCTWTVTIFIVLAINQILNYI